jgi:hypothetical protein
LPRLGFGPFCGVCPASSSAGVGRALRGRNHSRDVIALDRIAYRKRCIMAGPNDGAVVSTDAPYRHLSGPAIPGRSPSRQCRAGEGRK